MEASRGPETLEHRVIRRPRASRWQIIRRFFAWMNSLARYSWARARDRLRGDDSVETRGVRLREFFERLGAIATKIGQQLAVRVDFFPPEVCKELGRLMDSAPAFSVEVALVRIESSLGRPVDDHPAAREPPHAPLERLEARNEGKQRGGSPQRVVSTIGLP